MIVGAQVDLSNCVERAKNTIAFRPFVDVYRDMCDGAPLPVLHDLMLHDSMHPLLENVAVFNTNVPHKVIYRFCGTEIARRIGLDMTGRDLMIIVPEEARDIMLNDMGAMAVHPCGNFSSYTNLYSSGRSAIAESICLPAILTAGSAEVCLVSFHVTEPVPSAHSSNSDTQIGMDWMDSVFIDVGAGVPGDTAMAEYEQLKQKKIALGG